ncbi:MAG: Fe-Mn family superoxide dismutase [Nanoarchaeota archaeon]|nr:Fe-Mn family superoxide dismutase [Nanoarchaeota archaeon]
MEHQAKDFKQLLGLKGFSDKQLNEHFTLYQGYVKKLNEIEAKLKTTDKSTPNYSYNEYSELMRRRVVAFNGTYLHQCYFENLSKTPEPANKALQEAAATSFGNWENMIKELRAAAGSTPGWVLLTKNKIDGQLNVWIMYEHHLGLPVHNEIILALDCWEHAFMIDYGINKTAYLDAFFAATDWKIVSERLERIQQ